MAPPWKKLVMHCIICKPLVLAAWHLRLRILVNPFYTRVYSFNVGLFFNPFQKLIEYETKQNVNAVAGFWWCLKEGNNFIRERTLRQMRVYFSGKLFSFLRTYFATSRFVYGKDIRLIVQCSRYLHYSQGRLGRMSFDEIFQLKVWLISTVEELILGDKIQENVTHK